MIVRGHAIRAWSRAHPLLVDVALMLFWLGLGTLSWHAAMSEMQAADPSFRPSEARTYLGLVLTIAPLAVSRVAPIFAVLASCAGFVFARQVLGTMEASVTTVALSLVVYRAAAYGSPRWASAACTVAMVLVVGEVVAELQLYGADPLFRWFVVLYNLILFVAMWALGRAVRASRRRHAELVLRTIELEHEREENARRAVLDERVRIARELHDVVAHHVSVIGVQAGAARTVLRRDVDQAAAALSSIETESRQAVAELHRLLGLLRAPSDPGGLAPQPGLAQLAVLTGAAAQAGIDVDVRSEGDRRSLPPTIDASAYRIVQEALTNAIKHSGATRARVVLSYTATEFGVSIQDDGRGPTGPTGTGLGLTGMRERVSLHGGELDVGPTPGGGFAVRARLPIDAAAIA